MDEMRYGMQGFLKRVWAWRNSRPTKVKQFGFSSGYILGALNPKTGQRVGLTFSSIDTDVVNIFLGLIAEGKEKVHIILILDNAGYHGSKDLKIPENITLIPLPPYSPELNPVERLWRWLKNNYLGNRLYKNITQIIKAGCEAWNKLSIELVISICFTDWLKSF